MKSEPSMKAKMIHWFLRQTPQGVRRAVMVGLARLVYQASLKHRLITLHNLLRSFPEKPWEEIEKIAKASYESFAICAAEFPDTYHMDANRLSRRLSVSGLENYEKARRKGKGVLLISGHFGNWEFGNAALALFSKPPVFMARRLDSRWLEEASIHARSLLGVATINKEGAMFPVLRLLRKGEAVKLLMDQNVAASEGVFVDFFGRPACTTPGVALMALHTGATVLTIFTTRMPDGKYVTQIGDEIETVKTGDHDADVLVNTQNYIKAIESHIRQYPEQWLWLHQRWKTKRVQQRRHMP